jgi:DUF1680 family protein
VSDSDLYKWTEAAVLAARGDLADPVIAAVVAAQDPDGYLHTFYGHDGMGRYFDPDTGHELYCMGHCIEAAVSHHEATGSRTLLDAAIRIGQHVVGRFGPGRDERVDLHPEMELALCRLAAVTGDRRLVEHARWMIEQTLGRAGLTLETFAPGGHAVRFLYLASGIAEVAAATGDARWRAAALRLWSDVVERHGYCTGAVGGRWMGEAIGRPYELDDETSYAESCAAVAMAHFTRRIWWLGGDPACLEHLDMLLFNALPAGVGADGASWCYANALAFTDAPERNPWVLPFEYGSAMALKWFPPRRHEWFDVMCCPPNLARAFAQVSSWVCQEDGTTLRILLPLACSFRRHFGGPGGTSDNAFSVNFREKSVCSAYLPIFCLSSQRCHDRRPRRLRPRMEPIRRAPGGRRQGGEPASDNGRFCHLSRVIAPIGSCACPTDRR